MKALHRIFVALTCFPVVLSLLLLPLLPERIPAHYKSVRSGGPLGK